MKLFYKRIISLILALMMICGRMPMTAFAADESAQATTNELEGKKLSILGASMSTYNGVSNNADCNTTIGNNAVYYTEGKLGVYKNDTWWMQTTNDLGLELLVNNSWSGSSLLYERNGTVGTYVDRCIQLHMGTDTHGFTNASIAYIVVDEPAHTHIYNPTVIAPTCTEQGYTTYTCECGDSYASDYVDTTGHTYENSVCTGCGTMLVPPTPSPEAIACWKV